MDNKLIIDIKNITIDTRLVNVSAQVLAGQQIHILGANGAGKSTLLSAISGYLPMDGDILIDGKSIRQYRIAQLSKQRAYLPQWVNEPLYLKFFNILACFRLKQYFLQVSLSTYVQTFNLHHYWVSLLVNFRVENGREFEL